MLDSGAGWSERPPGGSDDDAAAPSDHPFRTAEAGRYEALDELGKGGMGTVVAALDRRLGREVALKTLTLAADEDGARAARRLAREAWITARLDHPGIVPVHDAGATPDGRLFYTMRLVRGRALSEALRTGASLPARLVLLRHFLAACHAVAHAHAVGVVHRDLKPANIMVGPHGETQVVDWGLAGLIDEPVGRAADGPGEGGVAPRLYATAFGGTPAYMSPAQAAGEPASRRDDVWSLGVILYELLAGTPPPPGGPPADGPARLRALDAPPELVTIVETALGGGFADAGALASELEAYLDGRRVRAHAYTSLELVRRLARAWRVPLIVGGLGLLVTLAVFGVTWRRVLAEQARARASEVRALERHARAAQEAGEDPEAELVATRVLALRESAEARGVLAGALAGGRPVAARHARVPGCPRVLAARGERVVCADGATLALAEAGTGARRWAVARRAAEAAVLADGRVAVLDAHAGLALLGADTGEVLVAAPRAVPARGLQVSPDERWLAAGTAPHDVVVLDTAARTVTSTGRVCEPSVMAALALGAGALVAVCADGRVLVVELATGARRWLALHHPPGYRVATSALVLADERRLLVGGVDGTALILDLVDGSQAAPLRLTDGATHGLTRRGGHVLVTSGRGRAALWDLASRTELLRLPLGGQHRFAVDGEELLGLGAGVWRWRLPPRPRPRRFAVPAGLSGAAVSPDGRWLAVARGDGRVTVWSRADGVRVAELDVTGALPAAVVKRVAFAPDGTKLAATVAGAAAVRVFDTAAWAPLPYDASIAARRVAFLADGRMLAAPYGDGLDLWAADGRRTHLDVPRVRDAWVAPGASEAWLLLETDELAVWRDAGLTRLGAAEGASALATSTEGRVLATLHPDGLRVLDRATGAVRWHRAAEGVLEELVVAPDGGWVAAGTSAGAVEVWRVGDGARVAVLRGHRERTGSFALGGGEELISTGWDGVAHAWALDALTAPAGALAASTLTAWGVLDVDAAPAPRGE